ncbi:hypothetical protein Scep_001755 [Stephania cephalantha]|uniref:Uncharacterized protein n=1 Tax=Stephania cephalantha TaxID=152367 RepID=A0AAP0LCG2_9MAGN
MRGGGGGGTGGRRRCEAAMEAGSVGGGDARQRWRRDRWEEAVRGSGGRSSGGFNGWQGGRRRRLVRGDDNRQWWEPAGEGKWLGVGENLKSLKRTQICQSDSCAEEHPRTAGHSLQAFGHAAVFDWARENGECRRGRTALEEMSCCGVLIGGGPMEGCHLEAAGETRRLMQSLGEDVGENNARILKQCNSNWYAAVHATMVDSGGGGARRVRRMKGGGAGRRVRHVTPRRPTAAARVLERWLRCGSERRDGGDRRSRRREDGSEERR